ncbi:MAG: hypothetical protein V4733_01340 [Verrucomicrobiota bacterium]
MKFEERLTADLLRSGLLAEKPPANMRGRIGQTFSAVALGGLRTLAATFLNLRAFTAFTEHKWDEVEATYDIIVGLAPRTTYYWESGWHHMAYNAAAACFTDTSLPLYRRKDEWRTWIYKGKAFLERGIEANPDDGQLYTDLGFMLSDSNKFVAFPDPDQCLAAAAEAYRKAAQTGNAMEYVTRARFYALARVSGGEAEALAMARTLYENPRNRTPTLENLLFVLESWEQPASDATARAIRIFGNEREAYQSLSKHWVRTGERFPVYGVAKAMAELEDRLNLPADQRVSRRPLPPPPDPESWFEKGDE